VRGAQHLVHGRRDGVREGGVQDDQRLSRQAGVEVGVHPPAPVRSDGRSVCYKQCYTSHEFTLSGNKLFGGPFITHTQNEEP
jgi:hypothetical protein